MKTVHACIAISMLVLSTLFSAKSIIAAECSSDAVVRRWIDERDRAAERVLKAWAKGAPTKELAGDVAIALSNEVFVCSKCRDQKAFTKDKLILLGKGSAPKIETVPGMILEYLVGEDILSPWRQFPSESRKGVTRR